MTSSQMQGEPADMAMLLAKPHRRFNLLSGEWVFVSPHRTARPWQGKVEERSSRPTLSHDPECYLCPGNHRAGTLVNPQYISTFVFDNDYPAFDSSMDELTQGTGGQIGDELLRAHRHAGINRVICYSPRHDLSLGELPESSIRDLIMTWASQTAELGKRWRWVQVFENRGEMMGCSSPHPHGQIWAGDFLPNEPAKELVQQSDWMERKGSKLLLDYAEHEIAIGTRSVLQDEYWVVLVPWWAIWPFETLILPRRSVGQLADLTSKEVVALAKLLGELVRKYDRLFAAPFPYSFGWHGRPGADLAAAPESSACQLHAHFYPPLLRSATVRKFMVGYELLAEAQRDLTPEDAARRLREA